MKSCCATLPTHDIYQFIGYNNDLSHIFAIVPLLHAFQRQCLRLNGFIWQIGGDDQLVAHFAVDLYNHGNLIRTDLIGIALGPTLQMDATLMTTAAPQLLADMWED